MKYHPEWFFVLMLPVLFMALRERLTTESRLDEDCVQRFNLTNCTIENRAFYVSPADIACRCVNRFIETDDIINWDGSDPEHKILMQQIYIKKNLDVIYLTNNDTIKYLFPGLHSFDEKETVSCYFDGVERPVLELDEMC